MRRELLTMKKEYKMSQARLDELKDELTYLKTVREKEVADLIKEARGFGDLSENSEYDEAKTSRASCTPASRSLKISSCTPSLSTRAASARTL